MYQRYKCVICGNEQVSRAKKPRCKECRSVKLNQITEFTVEKQEKPTTKEPKQKKESWIDDI